jgi:IMP cyclohydrolase
MNVYENLKLGEILKENSYPGRGIVIGKTPDGAKAVVAYFIMGRSENSRNRVFVEEGQDVIIHPFDYSKVQDPSLIIYSPIKNFSNYLIVTNGDQTDTIDEYLRNGKTFEEALLTRRFEPDAPNFTPRISGLITFEPYAYNYKLSILKSADAEGTECNRYTFDYCGINGVGHFIHTYNCDGNPIPTFTGEPERVAIPNDIDEFANDIWNNLDENNKISLYVRYVGLKDGIVENRMFNKNK